LYGDGRVLIIILKKSVDKWENRKYNTKENENYSHNIKRKGRDIYGIGYDENW
jgi:hypothetical protein